MCDTIEEAKMFIDLTITAYCEGLATQEQIDKAKALRDRFCPSLYTGWKWMGEATLGDIDE